MKFTTKYTALALLITLVFTSLPSYAERLKQIQKQKQPLMEIAMNNLVRAEKALKKAAWDKGGHRVKALHYVRRAMQEVEMGIRYSNKTKAKKNR